MAKIDLARRAQIGQERRARTRSALLAATAAIIARDGLERLTIDGIVQQAGVAKGTFYVHFVDMNELIMAVADDLIHGLDELLQPRRLAEPDPVMRIALGCSAFIEKAIAEPSWGAVVARMALSHPSVGTRARERLLEDIGELMREPGVFERAVPKALVFEIISGILLQVVGGVAGRRIGAEDARAAIAQILHAIGIKQARIAVVMRTLEGAAATAPQRARSGPGDGAVTRRRKSS